MRLLMKTVKGKRYMTADGRQGTVIDPRTGRRVLGSVPENHAVLKADDDTIFTADRQSLSLMLPQLRGG